jgi:hypothetical protein
MANPTAQVPTTSVPFSEEKVYWPLDPTDTSATYYAGEMMGMRLSNGYAFHFDDSAAMLFLGTKEGIVHRIQSDTPTADFKELVRKPRYLEMPLLSGTATIPGSIGKIAYAADSGHVQLTPVGLTYANVVGVVVDIGRSGSTGGQSSGGILTLTGATSVFIQPLSADGITQVGTARSPFGGTQTLAANSTITLPTAGVNVFVTNTAATTGIVLTPGRYDGDTIKIVNIGTNTATFATSTTSNVAGGTTSSVASLASLGLVYSSAKALWY